MAKLPKKRILLHSNYKPSSSGGIEFVVKQLVSIFDHDFNVSVFYGGANNSRFYSGRVLHIERKIVVKIRGACLLSFGNLIFFKRALKSDIVIFQEPYPSLWLALVGLRFFGKCELVCYMHADPSAGKVVSFIYRKLRRSIFNSFHVVATSEPLSRSLDLNERTKHPLTVIPLAVPDKFFGPESLPATKGNPFELPSRFFLYYGRLADYKGLKVLCECAFRLPACNFVIAGVGPLSDYIENFIEDHKLSNVIFIKEFISEEEKKFLLSQCHCFILPSLNKNEAFGLVQLEAMSASRPIINTKLGNGVNFVAPSGEVAVGTVAGDVDSLVDAVCRLAGDEELATLLGKNGRERFENFFSRESFSIRWMDLISSL